EADSFAAVHLEIEVIHREDGAEILGEVFNVNHAAAPECSQRDFGRKPRSSGYFLFTPARPVRFRAGACERYVFLGQFCPVFKGRPAHAPSAARPATRLPKSREKR